MDQLTFGDADFAAKGKKTRKERFLSEMEQVVPWSRGADLFTRVAAQGLAGGILSTLEGGKFGNGGALLRSAPPFGGLSRCSGVTPKGGVAPPSQS
jgi:hypothetical protein